MLRPSLREDVLLNSLISFSFCKWHIVKVLPCDEFIRDDLKLKRILDFYYVAIVM